MGLFRDEAADRFENHTGSPCLPRAGSRVSCRGLTAVIIDSGDFIAARRRVETEARVPAGPKIAFTGGQDFNDYQSIQDCLHKARAKYPNIVLIMADRRRAPNGSPQNGPSSATSVRFLQARIDQARQRRAGRLRVKLNETSKRPQKSAELPSEIRRNEMNSTALC
jgi:hypothetical protein